MLGVTRLLLIFVGGKVFEVVLSLTFMVLCSSLILLMFEKEIRHLLRTILVGGCLEWFSSWSGSESGRSLSFLWWY